MHIAKKFTPASAVLLFIQKTAAVSIIGLVMGITMVIIGGVVVYKFIQFFHSPAWTNPGGGNNTTNTVSSVNIYYEDRTTQVGIVGEITPNYSMTTNGWGTYAAGSPMNGGNGFNVTYGLDLSSNPVVSLDNSGAAIQTTVADGSNYTFSVAVNVGLFSDVITFSSTNMMNANDQNNFDLSMTNNNAGATTNAYGDTITDTGGMLSTNLVILQCSTDLSHWWNICTNTVSPGVMQTYTDTNCLPAAFYRLAYPPQ